MAHGKFEVPLGERSQLAGLLRVFAHRARQARLVPMMVASQAALRIHRRQHVRHVPTVLDAVLHHGMRRVNARAEHVQMICLVADADIVQIQVELALLEDLLVLRSAAALLLGYVFRGASIDLAALIERVFAEGRASQSLAGLGRRVHVHRVVELIALLHGRLSKSCKHILVQPYLLHV